MSGERRELRLDGFRLEAGLELEEVRQAYRLIGSRDAGGSLVVVFHALTGSSRVEEWWSGVVGEGRAIDPARHPILCLDLLGSQEDPTPLPGPIRRGDVAVTPRDHARLAARVVQSLGASRVALVTGGSLGGMVALEWAALGDVPTNTVVAFASPAAHPAAAVGWNFIQRLAIQRAGREGLAIARMIGMQTYRTAEEFEDRFGRRRDAAEFEVNRYLWHHGNKLVDRYDPERYLVLLAAMDAHDVGRGREGVGPALKRFPGRLIGVGIPGDRLYRDQDVRAWVEEAGAEYRRLETRRGHDGFLLESEQVGAILRDALCGSPEGSCRDGSPAAATAPRAHRRAAGEDPR